MSNIVSLLENSNKTLEDIEINELNQHDNKNGVIQPAIENFHLLNTNKSTDEADTEWMKQNGIAVAYHHPWKLNINRIKKNDIIFLYENGGGIVGYGQGTGIVKKRDRHNAKDECHYQELTNYKTLETPISAAKIKKILNRHVVFRNTMSAMPDGQKILDFINN